MIRSQRCSRIAGVILLTAAVGSAPGCTLFDEVFPGTFTPDQPKGEVTVVGKINIDRASGTGSEGCAAGRALFWGIARNTGDVDVDDVYIEIDALDAARAVLASYRVHVFNGEVSETTPPSGSTSEEPVTTAGTSLAVDQSGTFEVCTGLPFGSVVDTAYRTDFIVVQEIDTK